MHNFGVHKLPIASKAATLTWLYKWFYFLCLTIFNSQTIIDQEKVIYLWILIAISNLLFYLLPWFFSILRCEKFAQILAKVMKSTLEKQKFPNLFVEKTNKICYKKSGYYIHFHWNYNLQNWFYSAILCSVEPNFLKRGSISAKKQDEIVVFLTLKLYWCSNDRNYLKFNISCTLNLKFAKSPP